MVNLMSARLRSSAWFLWTPKPHSAISLRSLSLLTRAVWLRRLRWTSGYPTQLCTRTLTSSSTTLLNRSTRLFPSTLAQPWKVAVAARMVLQNRTLPTRTPTATHSAPTPRLTIPAVPRKVPRQVSLVALWPLLQLTVWLCSSWLGATSARGRRTAGPAPLAAATLLCQTWPLTAAAAPRSWAVLF